MQLREVSSIDLTLQRILDTLQKAHRDVKTEVDKIV